MASWLTGGSFTIRLSGTSPILELPSPGPTPLRTAPPACCGDGFECSEASLLLALPPFGTTPNAGYGRFCPISPGLHPPASQTLSKTPLPVCCRPLPTPHTLPPTPSSPLGKSEEEFLVSHKRNSKGAAFESSGLPPKFQNRGGRECSSLLGWGNRPTRMCGMVAEDTGRQHQRMGAHASGGARRQNGHAGAVEEGSKGGINHAEGGAAGSAGRRADDCEEHGRSFRGSREMGRMRGAPWASLAHSTRRMRCLPPGVLLLVIAATCLVLLGHPAEANVWNAETSKIHGPTSVSGGSDAQERIRLTLSRVRQRMTTELAGEKAHIQNNLHGFLEKPLALILGHDKSKAPPAPSASASSTRGRVPGVQPQAAATSASPDAEGGIGGKARAEAEATAFAGLTAGARDPRAAAKERIRKKAEEDSYERATSPGEIWKDIKDAQSHAESGGSTMGHGLVSEATRLVGLPPAQAAKELADMSQKMGSAVLSAVKGMDPSKMQAIMDALKAQEEAKKKKKEKGPQPPPLPLALAAPVNKTSHPPALKFDIETTHRFNPKESLSFERGRFKTFSLSYADQSLITGFVGKDIVQLGNYYTLTHFGCALDSNDPSMNGIDGILGMGMPDAALPNIPNPLIFALSSDRGGIEGANYINERSLHHRKFAFLSTDTYAELQLGGYDRDSTSADMVYMHTTSTTEYSVNVQSLTFGGIELLDWVDKDMPNALPAILDTGTTCLVIPDTTLDGRVTNKPYSKFQQIMTKGMSFYITINGHLFEIPYEFWWQRSHDAPCVQATPPSYAGLLLGDVLFQSVVVEFDLTHKHHPKIGIAPRNPLYMPALPGSGDKLKIPLIKTGPKGVSIEEPEEEAEDSGKGAIDHVPVMFNNLRTQYLANVSIGSPRQTFTVLLDTGSSTLAIFSMLPSAHGEIQVQGPAEDSKRAQLEEDDLSKESARAELKAVGGGRREEEEGGWRKYAKSLWTHRGRERLLQVEGQAEEGVERVGMGMQAICVIGAACAGIAGVTLRLWMRRVVRY